MSDLHEQLREAIRERQQRALAATPGPWTMRDGWGPAESDGLMRARRIADDQHATVIEPGDDVDLIGRREDFEYIALESPVAVLRHCERDLKVLQRHGVSYLCDDCGDPMCAECGHGPCDEIRDLADAYGIEVQP